jgi:uncharacterized protein with PIN domain
MSMRQMFEASGGIFHRCPNGYAYRITAPEGSRCRYCGGIITETPEEAQARNILADRVFRDYDADTERVENQKGA